MAWRLDGTVIGTGSVRAVVTAELRARSEYRAQRQPHPFGRERVRRTGRNLPVLDLAFAITGPAADVRRELELVQGVLDLDRFTLTAPPGVAVWRAYERVVLHADATLEEETRNEDESVLILRATCTVLGAWPPDVDFDNLDRDAYDDRIRGWFKKTATGWQRHDGVEFAAADGPRVTIPRQDGDDARAVAAATLEVESLGVSVESQTQTNRAGATRDLRVYDLTGFLIPAPAATGDVGVFEIVNVPSAEYLDHVPG